MNKWLVYVLIFAAGFVFVSLWSFWIVIHPPKIIIGRTPPDVGLEAQDVTITAPDGTKLSAWYIPSATLKKAIVLLHGYPAEKSDMLLIAKNLYPDFSLLLLDLRYFGESDGMYTTLGVKERGDVKATLDFLESKGHTKIGMFGFSLGGALSLVTAAEDERVGAVASYGSFADIRKLGWETYRHLWILKYPLVELMIFWSKISFGTSVTEVSPLSAAKEITVPTLIIHSKDDEQIAFSHAELLQGALNEDISEFYFVRGLHGHLPLDFNNKVLDFFRRSL